METIIVGLLTLLTVGVGCLCVAGFYTARNLRDLLQRSGDVHVVDTSGIEAVSRNAQDHLAKLAQTSVEQVGQLAATVQAVSAPPPQPSVQPQMQSIHDLFARYAGQATGMTSPEPVELPNREETESANFEGFARI